jgi:hypothetical protein
VRLEGLGQLKKIHLIGTRTHDLPVCSIVPQPTTLPRAPLEAANLIEFFPSSCSSVSLPVQASQRYMLVPNSKTDFLFSRQPTFQKVLQHASSYIFVLFSRCNQFWHFNGWIVKQQIPASYYTFAYRCFTLIVAGNISPNSNITIKIPHKGKFLRGNS